MSAGSRRFGLGAPRPIEESGLHGPHAYCVLEELIGPQLGSTIPWDEREGWFRLGPRVVAELIAFVQPHDDYAGFEVLRTMPGPDGRTIGQMIGAGETREVIEYIARYGDQVSRERADATISHE